MQIWLLITVAAVMLAAHTASGATGQDELVRFRPITQSEYEAIMGITDGRPVITEGRLILSGLTGLAAGLTTGWATSLIPSFLTSFSGLRTNAQKGAGNYPLCVIRAQDEGGRAGYQQQTNDQGPDQSQEYDNSNDNGADFDDEANKKPIVNCIVVVKDDEDAENDNQLPWHTTRHPTTSTRRPRPKWPTYFPPRPPTGGQAGGDGYINPLYWYHPYFQYPYGGFPGGYPSSYSGYPSSTQTDATTPEHFHDMNLSQAPAETNQSAEADTARKTVARPKRVRSRPASSRAKPIHPKVKRTEISSHPYAKISSYAESGYQPSLYPQFSYQSDYPKVSYTQALPYPAPVYVRSTTQRPRTARPKLQQIAEFDSEELDNSAEYIKVRSNDRI